MSATETPTPHTVPAPIQYQGPESAAPAQPFPSNPAAGHEVTIARVENTLAALDDQQAQADPRYAKLQQLKNKLAGGSGALENALGTSPDAGPSNGASEKLTDDQSTQLRAQVEIYRLLARNVPVPDNLLSLAQRAKPTTLLPYPYEIPLENGDSKLPYDLSRVLAIHQHRLTRHTTVSPPSGIDPSTILKEREHRIQNRIGLRVGELQRIAVDLPPHLRIQAEIELRALRLANLQMQVRHDILTAYTQDTTLETSINPFAYRRTKRQSLREARVTERLEKQQKEDAMRRKRQKHSDFLSAAMAHQKNFKEFHRNNLLNIGKVKKAVVTWHANNDRERKKEEARNEKLRMQKLMQEDEEGYRQMLDEKKDKRLVLLLQQTDEYVESLTGLVKQHQAAEKARKKQERRERKQKERAALETEEGGNESAHVYVRDRETGRVLRGDDAPKPEELDAWLETHPGFEVVPRDECSDSDDDSDDDSVVQNPVPVQITKDSDDLDGLTDEERAKRVIEKAKNENDDEYNATTRKQMESYYATAHKIKERVTEQHSSMGAGDPNLRLKPYQLKGLEWMVSLYNNNLNGILADEMGLGKTIQTVALITYLMEVKKINGPYLVIVPLSTISNWTMELEKWAPNVVKVVYKGTKETRRRLDQIVKRGQFNVLLTTYDYVLKEKAVLGKVRWRYMIIDEGHRLKNNNCKLTLMLNGFFSAQHRLLLTGTPLQNKLPELWALLNFLLPSIFSSCGTFEQWFNAPFERTGERVELSPEETMLIIRRLHKVLRPFLLRRLKKEVEAELPDKTEYVIKCDMSALQRLLYAHMQKGLLIDSKLASGGKALQNTMMHLRKLCNHPFLFNNVEDSCASHWGINAQSTHLMRVAGKFELLDRILPKMKTTNHRVLIFCQMTNCMNILEDFFNWRQWKYLRLDGSTKPDERGELLRQFNAPDSDIFIFILSTRAGGLGLNLQTADTVIIFDSDWNPHQDMQAQDRAHRIGQKREVRVLRLITANSIEEKILASAKFKLNVDEKVIQAGKFDQRSTADERRQILADILRAETEDDEEEEVPDDEAINTLIARSEEEFNLFQSMDIDRRREEASHHPRLPRLVEDKEIPPDIVRSAEQFEAQAAREASRADEPLGRRKKKQVDYSFDNMTEEEFLRSIKADEEDEEEIASSRSARKRASNRPPKGTVSTGEEENEDSQQQPSKKRRKGARVAADEDDEDSRSSPGPSGSGSAQAIDPSRTQLMPLLHKLYFTMISFKAQEDGRRVAEPFEQLPSRRELPDYYEVISQPMDFNKIKRRIKEGKYASIEEMAADVKLMCKNAQKYNVDGSDIFNDSVLLWHVWTKVVETLMLSAAQQKPAAAATDAPGSSGEAAAAAADDDDDKPKAEPASAASPSAS